MYLLGLDIGSTIIKAAIFDPDGNELGVFGVIAEQSSPKPGYYERDMGYFGPPMYAQSMARSMPISIAKLSAVSLTGHGNGAHLLDHQYSLSAERLKAQTAVVFLI